MAKGVKFGRKPRLNAYQRKEALQRLAEGATLTEIASSYGIGIATAWRLRQGAPVG